MTTLITPYESIFGRPSLSIPRYVLESFVVDEVDHQLKDRDEALALLMAHLADAQNRMKAHYNLRRRDAIFSIGDIVYFKIQPYQLSLLH